MVSANTDLKKVVVTGGNAGIGYALCRQLIEEDGCYVFMGARNKERGEAAIAKLIEASPECKDKIELL